MELFKDYYTRINKVDESNSTNIGGTPLFIDYLSDKNKGLHYLTEDENAMVDRAVLIFENEYGGDIKNLDEGFFGKLVGGAAGFLTGPMVGRVIAKALGIEKGILYDMLTSRLVGASLGVAIAKAMGGDYKK